MIREHGRHAVALGGISLAVDRKAHSLVMREWSDRHAMVELVGSGRMTVLPLPPRAPELNPSEASGSSSVRTGCPASRSNP